ncbi:MAG: hypothetical protein HGA76_11000 [Candidatus Firestonebacteria bacterium]|nr:hypothetical protein [Candidatus Firestonebacteria bacterium]
MKISASFQVAFWLLAWICVVASADSSLVFPVTAMVVSPTTPVLVDNFEDGDNQNALGGWWYAYNDSIGSHIYPNPFVVTHNAGNGAQGSNYFAQTTGNLVSDPVNYQNYVGMGTGLAPLVTTAVDLNQYTGLRLWVRGDGQIYRLKIVSKNIADRDYNFWGFNYSAPNGSWQQISIPWTSIFQGWSSTPANQVSRADALADARQLEWTPLNPTASFDLRVDYVEFFH